MWAQAHQHHLQQHPTEENGWELVDDQYKPVWFYGEQLPENIVQEEGDIEETEKEAEDDMDIASSDEEDISDEED